MEARQFELRDSGKTLFGVLIQEGRAARRRREVFAPGSVQWPSEGVGVLTRHHHGAPEVTAIPERQADGRITLKAKATDAIRAAVASGRKYMSVEFLAIRERRTEGGIREVLRAMVPFVALVAAPEYEQTGVEVRRRRFGGIRGKVKLGRKLSCRCRKNCNTIKIQSRALDSALNEALNGDREITAFFSGSYDRPIASISAGTLEVTRKGNVLSVAITKLPDTQPVRDFTASADTAFYALRPYFPDDQSTFTIVGETADFSKADLRGIEVAAITGPREGLERIELVERRSVRRRKLWL